MVLVVFFFIFQGNSVAYFMELVVWYFLKNRTAFHVNYLRGKCQAQFSDNTGNKKIISNCLLLLFYFTCKKIHIYPKYLGRYTTDVVCDVVCDQMLHNAAADQGLQFAAHTAVFRHIK